MENSKEKLNWKFAILFCDSGIDHPKLAQTPQVSGMVPNKNALMSTTNLGISYLLAFLINCLQIWGIIVWMFSHMTELNPQTLYRSQVSGDQVVVIWGSKPQISKHIVSLFSMTSLHPELLLAWIQIWSKGPSQITKPFPYLGKSQGFWSFLPGTVNIDQTNSSFCKKVHILN